MIPVLPLRDVVVYPHMVIPLFVGRDKSIQALERAMDDDKRILLDCGMVQGPRKISTRANRELGLDASTVDAVILSHAHIDHSGSLPRLVKMGFSGRIHCTEPTSDLLGVLLALLLLGEGLSMSLGSL